jgi:hypothetical protein
MAKIVHTKLNKIYSVSLVLIGWVLFMFGVYIEGPLILKLILLSAARVLPQALSTKQVIWTLL